MLSVIVIGSYSKNDYWHILILRRKLKHNKKKEEVLSTKDL